MAAICLLFTGSVFRFRAHEGGAEQPEAFNSAYLLNSSSMAPMGSYSAQGESTLDQFVAPGLRLWMLIALVSGVLLIMVVIVCCFMRIRIPRTKRQIDLIAAKRKMRKERKTAQHDERSAAIVMNSMPHKPSSAGDRARSSSTEDKRPLVHKTSSKQQTAV